VCCIAVVCCIEWHFSFVCVMYGTIGEILGTYTRSMLAVCCIAAVCCIETHDSFVWIAIDDSLRAYTRRMLQCVTVLQCVAMKDVTHSRVLQQRIF